MNKLTWLDKQILNILQKEFPLSEKPYEEIALRLNISENEVLQRIKELKDNGIIRRIGAVMESKKLGFYSTLCACKVPEDRIAKVALVINNEKGVTHNYIRDHYYNLWFTLTVSSAESADKIIKNIEQELHIDIKSMPALKVYKIKVLFEMGETDAL
ncbi:MAG: AsnC family transcriptional regulator [Syntrophomonadaceae bacterium]|nr:AsnC family transcriptional regulator [Syntrophomonadaceae bacterium]MDD3888463.1 AsnC family transcriptional regulator [Syntrophomonadaceae bacterium]MDD4549216.1 AsnC family transcriptional regulator [Syntrophomonadaceae bacterium]